MLLSISKLTRAILLALAVGLTLSGCVKNNANNLLRRSHHSQSVDTLSFYGEDVTPDTERALLAENVIYFDFDRDDIKDRYRLVLLAHAKKLLENPNLSLRIDGHTDARGSAEYNIGLGERRAKAVANFIEMRGVRNNRLIVVSYGKEKPAATGDHEESWRLNRRAELAYE